METQEFCIKCGELSQLALCDRCTTKYLERKVKELKELLNTAMNMLSDVAQVELKDGFFDTSVCRWCYVETHLAGHAKDCPYDQLDTKVAEIS